MSSPSVNPSFIKAIIAEDHPSKMASVFKAGGTSTAWSVFSIYWSGPARPVASLITGTVGKVTAQTLKPLIPAVTDITQRVTSPFVNRVAPAISDGSASLIVDTFLPPAIEVGKQSIDAIVLGAINELKLQKQRLKEREEILKADLPKLIQEYTEKSTKWASTQ